MQETLIQAAKDGRWPIVAAAMIWFIVQAMKSDRIPVNVPKHAQPWVALGLGIASGASESFLGGAPLLDSLLLGFFAGASAIATQEAFVPAIKAAKDSMRPPPMALLCLGLVGCGASAEVSHALHAARDVAIVAEACTVARKGVQDAACNGNAECLARVREEYAPIADVLDAFHAGWCALAPEHEGCAR